MVKGKKPRCNSVFYQKKVLNPVLRDLKKRTEDTGDVSTTRLFKTDDWIFQQDGATCHTSRSTKAYLAKKVPNLLENWPPNSPDLNLIENLWGILNTHVYDKQKFRSIIQMKNAVGKAWRNISVEVLQNLYKSMPRRIQEVTKRKGGTLDK